MKSYDLISGIVLIFFAIVLGIASHDLAFYGPMGPKEGFFPLVLSILFGSFGLIILLKACIVEPASGHVKLFGPKKGKLLVYVTSFILFPFALNWLGYTLTMVLFLVFILRFVERISSRSTTIIVISSVIVSYVLFVRFLGIPLPEGILTPVANFLREMGMRGS